MEASQPLISVVVPELNEAGCLPKLHAELRRVCDDLPYRFEFLFVDDGSTDGSVEVLAQLHQQDPRISYLALSRNFGHQAALSAGLAHAAGDAVIMMDGDLQHPPSLIPQLLESWQAGHDVVNTVRLATEGAHPLKSLWSSLFYRFVNWITNVRIEPGGADFRLMSRRAVDELNAMPERHRFLRGLVPWLGFRQSKIAFRAPPRYSGRAKLGFVKNLRFALDGLTSFSLFPLRLLSMVGWGITGLSLLYGLYALLAHFFSDATIPGWTSLILCVIFFGGFQLAVIGMLGEYIGRVLEQVKGRPLYIIRESAGLATTLPWSVAGRPAAGPAHVRRLTG